MSENNTEQRKLSDVILSLEDKVNTLIKIFGVIDMNSKIMLDRVNKIFAYIDQIQKEYAADSQEGPPISNNEPIQISADQAILELDAPINRGRGSRSETYNTAVESPIIFPEVKPTLTQPVAQSVGSTSDKKVPIVQRVTDNTGKDLFMADVSIFDYDNKLVAKPKTSAAGKWQAYLKPGIYSVNIVKTDTASKKKFEAMQTITVPESNSIVTLPTAIIKR